MIYQVRCYCSVMSYLNISNTKNLSRKCQGHISLQNIINNNNNNNFNLSLSKFKHCVQRKHINVSQNNEPHL